MFHSVARRYDLMNDLMSFGLHRAWKDALVTAVDPPKTTPFSVLDIAGGTGDIAFRIIDRGGPRTVVTVCDINPDMLEVGRGRAMARVGAQAVTFSEANAEALAGYWGERRRLFRILKIGGRFVCLEFSSVDVPALDRLYDFYSFNVIPALGRMVVGEADSYRYLVESIRRFPKPQAFASMLRAAGFARVSFQTMSGGIVALHSGWRL